MQQNLLVKVKANKLCRVLQNKNNSKGIDCISCIWAQLSLDQNTVENKCYCWRRWVFVRKSLLRRKRLCCWENLFCSRKLKLDHEITGRPLCQNCDEVESKGFHWRNHENSNLQLIRVKFWEYVIVIDCWRRIYQWCLAKSKELVRTYVSITWELLKNQMLRIIGIATWTYIVDFCKAWIRIR